jgi:hypothetical protein
MGKLFVFDLPTVRIATGDIHGLPKVGRPLVIYSQRNPEQWPAMAMTMVIAMGIAKAMAIAMGLLLAGYGGKR